MCVPNSDHMVHMTRRSMMFISADCNLTFVIRRAVAGALASRRAAAAADAMMVRAVVLASCRSIHAQTERERATRKLCGHFAHRTAQRSAPALPRKTDKFSQHACSARRRIITIAPDQIGLVSAINSPHTFDIFTINFECILHAATTLGRRLIVVYRMGA